MGRNKEYALMLEERGYDEIDTYVCKNCVQEKGLHDYIVENGKLHHCNYCKKRDSSISTEKLIEQIMDGISFYYDLAVNRLGWVDGEYVGTKYDLDDILADLDVVESLRIDIETTIGDDIWCDKEPYDVRQNIKHKYMWDSFSRMVKNKTRYVFFRLPDKYEYYPGDNFHILDKINEATNKLELFETIPINTIFYRARMHDSLTNLTEDKDLSSPPNRFAKSNRMSAEGISIFYGASDKETAVKEVYTTDCSHVTYAKFRNLKELTVLNLVSLREISIPSIYDVKRRELREEILFLKSLVADITKPIETMEHIEYIPAQVIAEYFRYIGKYNNKQIDGIMYPSAKINNSTCYALFVDQEGCLPPNTNKYFPSVQLLQLDIESITRKKVDFNIII